MTYADASRPGQEPHILVIDDCPQEINSLVLLLKAQGWRVTQASDAQQGYQRAQALRPELILLDVRMPGMDGFTLGRLLREVPVLSQVPIIFLTSAGDLHERLEGLSLGAVDYVLKSCAAEEVLARIRIHLQLAQRLGTSSAVAFNDERLHADQVMLRATMRFIGQYLGELPSLAELARKVGTHDKRLSAIFRTHLNMTVFAYIREARLRRGQELLAESTMSVQDVADQVGFRSACNFTTAFRERLGMTPSQFRQQIMDMTANGATA